MNMLHTKLLVQYQPMFASCNTLDVHESHLNCAIMALTAASSNTHSNCSRVTALRARGAAYSTCSRQQQRHQEEVSVLAGKGQVCMLAGMCP
jgi:hypothetical protein